ncbi:MAG TPA: BadF/BadG/BcrA/BcrD ATPase family protein [Pseudolysinimonas sp.]|nr:BadF/BadG/BcrA/BcrD ATPase family protein [Pseudolysinimonas sp.]
MTFLRILAVDAGQTGVRTRVIGSDGSEGVETEFAGVRTDAPLVPQLAAAVQAVAAATGPIAVVAVGSTGWTAGSDDAAALREATAGSGVGQVFFAHDSVTSYLGALGDARGAVVAAGTGVVTLAVGADSVARVDGWGNLMGDAGSGFWIGRAALDAVMRAHDGRGPQTLLTEAARAEFGDLEHAYIELQADPGRVRRIAGYARWVADASEAGDAVAIRVGDAAAGELVLSVTTALRCVGEGSPDAGVPLVCGLGGVLRSRHIAERFAAGLSEIWPELRVQPPLGTGLDGAALLPTLSDDSALAAHVARG